MKKIKRFGKFDLLLDLKQQGVSDIKILNIIEDIDRSLFIDTNLKNKSKTVENRLRRQLTYSFQEKKEILNRVRGKINHLITYRKKLLSKGQISCQFNELTVDNLRNRYARSALEKISMIIT